MGDSCGGCPYHDFPYKAIPPILIDGKRIEQTFNTKEDVWKIIDLLIEEVNNENLKGSGFDVSSSVNAQLPFFSCKNIFFDKQIQKDIRRYSYCKDLNVSPYKGDFGGHPALWVDKYFIIRKAFAKLEKENIRQAKFKAKG